MIRKIGWLVAVITLLATGAYTFVYLYRWEWNRALFTSLLFIAVEVGIALLLVLRRLSRVEQRMQTAPDPAVLARVREHAPEREHFAWLERSMSRTGVFVGRVVARRPAREPDRGPGARARPR
jgi:hypothetical protein